LCFRVWLETPAANNAGFAQAFDGVIDDIALTGAAEVFGTPNQLLLGFTGRGWLWFRPSQRQLLFQVQRSLNQACKSSQLADTLDQ